jgi:arylsulfatase A-like enzyme
VIAAAVVTVAILVGVRSEAGLGATGATPPNIVVIMTDDQTTEQMRVMRHVLADVGQKGVTFDQSFVNYPLCCPSRSTFLTGLYAHNHHVIGNVAPHGGFRRFEALHANNDLPVWLQGAGYYTTEIGKYLNQYGDRDPTLIPPGWNDWNAVVGEPRPYDYQLNENGTLTSFGSAPGDYLDDVISGKAVDFIRGRATQNAPFFLYVAYKAPHVGGPHLQGSGCTGHEPEPPVRHYGAFANEPLPKPPSFNEADVSDKPTQISSLPPLTDADIAEITTRYRCELESLLGVDDGVHRIVNALKAEGQLTNTLFIYTSDNGFLHGEHRLAIGKSRVYEPSIRVPLLMRGPGIPRGATSGEMVTNADLAPTIVQAAQATPGLDMDGRSLLDPATHPNLKRGRRLLNETPTYDAIHTQRFVYVEYDNGEKELYDLRRDPEELQNVADSQSYSYAQGPLAAELAALKNCQGGSCRSTPSLDLSLNYSSGNGCAKTPIDADVTGDDSILLDKASFTIGSSRQQVHSAPFGVELPPAQLHHHRHNHVRAVAELVDGRVMTFAANFPPAC